jgi:hypothetical protein
LNGRREEVKRVENRDNIGNKEPTPSTSQGTRQEPQASNGNSSSSPKISAQVGFMQRSQNISALQKNSQPLRTPNPPKPASSKHNEYPSNEFLQIFNIYFFQIICVFKQLLAVVG